MPTATATLNGITLASSSTYEVVENNIYFPPSSINKEYFTPSNTSTHCPWKGDASYYTISVEGKEVKDGAWYYPHPLEKATGIRDYVAFCMFLFFFSFFHCNWLLLEGVLLTPDACVIDKTKIEVEPKDPGKNTITR